MEHTNKWEHRNLIRCFDSHRFSKSEEPEGMWKWIYAILTVGSHTYTLLWLTKTTVSVRTSN